MRKNKNTAKSPPPSKIDLKATDEIDEFAENIINTVREPLLVLDDELRVIKASRSFYLFFKVNPEDTIGRLIYELGNHQWDIPKLRDLLEKILPEKTTFDNYEVEHKFSSIGTRIMLLNARQIKRGLGKEKIILLAFEDVTMRKRKERSLSEKSRLNIEYLNILLNHAHAPIITWDASLHIKRFNHEFEKLSGYNKSEVEDKRIEMLFPENESESTLELIKDNIGDENSKVIEINILTKDKKIRTVLWNSANISDEKGEKTVATIAQDITERKRTEMVLSESEKKTRALLDAIPDLIFRIDREGTYLDYKADKADLYHQSGETIIGKRNRDITPPEFADLIERYIRQTLDSGEIQEFEYQMDNPTHGLRNYEARMVVSGKDEVIALVRDITARKKLETNLSTATEIAKLGYWEFDVKSENFIFDEQYYRLIHGSTTEKQGGNIISAEDFAGRLVHPDDTKMVSEKLFEAICSPDPEYSGQAEARLFRDNGDITTVMVRFKVEKDDNGRTIKVIGINQDITERKFDEEKINSLAKFPSENPDPVLRISKEGNLLFANKASHSFFTWKLETGKPAPAILQNIVNDVFKQKKIREIEIEHNKRIFLVHAVPILESDYTNLYIRDITNRKQEDEKFKISLTKYQVLFDSFPLGITISDKYGNIIECNDKAEILLGLTKEDQLKRQIHGQEWSIFKSNGLPFPQEEYPSVIALNENRLVENIEMGIVKEENDITWLSVTAAPIPIKDFGVAIVYSDITQQKLVREELIKSKVRAEESDRLKSAFLANMSHEIRTPMNGILGFTQLLKTPKLTGEEQQAFIDIIEKSGARMLNTINDIINISRIESGQVEISISKTYINKQVEDIFNFFKPEAEKKELGFSFQNALPANKEIIKTDKDKVVAVLTNLVKNALKFTQSGSIVLGYEMKDKFLEFFVKDTGSGILAEQKEIIFERFRQGSESLTRNYEGAGLGLSISKAYVEILGGKIWIESKVGQGSTFRFTVPYLNGIEEKEQIQPVAEKKIKPIRKLKILVVEDDESSLMLLKIIIEPLANELLQANTGHKAVEACRNNPDIDLVLMDIHMPEMNGYEATLQIRKFNTEVFIIAQTAYALIGDREKALEAGCNDYITKPIKQAALLKMIEKFCSCKM